MDGIKYEYIDNALLIRDKYSSCAIEWNNASPAAKEQLGAGEWMDGWPHQRILVPPHIDAGDARPALDRFASPIPQHIFDSVSPFRDHQWMMLRLLASNPYSAELAESNPILAYCLANNQQFKDIYKHQISWEQANLYSRRKQKLILQWLGFPSTNLIVKLLKKIDRNEMSISLLRLLRAALKTDNQTVKLLSHYKSITPGMLGLLRKSIEPHVTSELLADVAQNPNERSYPHTGDRLAEIYQIQRIVEDQMPVPQFLTIDSVIEFHQRLKIEARAAMQRVRKMHVRAEESLGEPPIKGNDDIVPITTKSQLALEGKDMKNCVGSYASKVKQGDVYIYRVLRPERATLSIKQRADGVWDTMEIKAKCNEHVSPGTQAAVDAWLKTADDYKDFSIRF